MSFDWKLYVDLSDELITHQRTPSLKEAYLRSAISRSYYGVFCIARALLISRTVFFPRENIHKFVREEFNRAQSNREKQIGSKLLRLWTERKAADYEQEGSFNNERAKTAYKIAVDTLNLLEQLSNPNKK